MSVVSSERAPTRCVLRREACQDADGNPYTVIVWQDQPPMPFTSYTLEDGSEVHYDDECGFTVVDTGRELTRCDN